MGRNKNNSKSKKEGIRKEKEDRKSNKNFNIIFLVYFIVLYLLYRNNEIILFNIKWWYYVILYLISSIIIYIFFQIPFATRIVKDAKDSNVKIFISVVFGFFLAVPIYYFSKFIIDDLVKDTIFTENCEILEVKKGRYRRGGDYYNLKVNFRGKEETIDLNNNLYQQLEKVSLTKNHAIIKVKPSIFNIYVVENVLIESKNLPK